MKKIVFFLSNRVPTYLKTKCFSYQSFSSQSFDCWHLKIDGNVNGTIQFNVRDAGCVNSLDEIITRLWCYISSKMRLFGQCPGNDFRCKHDNDEDVSNLVNVVTNNSGKEGHSDSCHAYPFIRYGHSRMNCQ